MRVSGLAFAFVAALSGFSGDAAAGEIDQMASNLEKSCSNHFRKPPNRSSNDSRKFCRCFAAEFTATVSFREIDRAGGVMTAEIERHFEHAANECGRDIAPDVAEAGKAWALQSN